MYNWTEEDIQFVRKASEIKKKGHYVQSQTLTEHYNRILGKKRSVTNCGTCLRAMVTELEKALAKWESEQEKIKAQEAAKKAEEEAKVAELEDATNNKVPDTQDVTQEEVIKEEPENADKPKSQPSKGRKEKSK